ncbi:hypothetical protein [Zunongwangia pacifica]|uniref:Uncharacterized protein n=1 Tax=Zunongwangia pacifica TaxID=2911062 RepID=A0A9X2A0G9_9FLAO|nr:hypothetical protein [Zunongwangia pacifica]MCL6217924.1 hypothetical protein [Zunongwangia pacifica]
MKVLPLDTLGDKAEMLGAFTVEIAAMMLPFALFTLIAFLVYRIFRKKKLNKS